MTPESAIHIIKNYLDNPEINDMGLVHEAMIVLVEFAAKKLQ